MESPVIADDSIRAIVTARSDSLFASPVTKAEISTALNHVRMIKSQIVNYSSQIETYESEYRVFQIQWHKILANSMACIVMFLIGAPLGAIIKRGGLGVPVLASIIFFIFYYIMSMMGDKWARQGAISVPMGIWMADTILFVIGLLFLRQARVDARLFEADFYRVVWDKLKVWLTSKKQISKPVTWICFLSGSGILLRSKIEEKKLFFTDVSEFRKKARAVQRTRN